MKKMKVKQEIDHKIACKMDINKNIILFVHSTNFLLVNVYFNNDRLYKTLMRSKFEKFTFGWKPNISSAPFLWY